MKKGEIRWWLREEIRGEKRWRVKAEEKKRASVDQKKKMNIRSHAGKRGIGDGLELFCRVRATA